MCGIAGVAALTGVLPPDVMAAVPAMTERLRHRGPDGDGFFSDSRVCLGHRRLAIIDREGGRQPLSNEDESVWVTFNGEIYNHRDLRSDLQLRGHRFRTNSDTEVIVHAYDEYGVGCVDRLEGMFAFAVYDRRNREVLLARDRIGKKPLFFAVFANVLHFASEIKALAQSPLWKGEIDASALRSYFSLGYSIAPATMFRDVRQLEPGCSLRLRDGAIEIRKYWDVECFDTFLGGEAEALDEITHLLRASVSARLESEVPLGAFLSGGIDSGLVVSYMAEVSSTPTLTTSVGFSDHGHNELSGARATAEHLGTNHSSHLVDPDCEHVLDAIVDAFDQPFADSSSVPTFYVSREARRHVTVALSGDGGDELFGGYDFRYVPHAAEERIRRVLPRAVRSSLGSIGKAWPRHSRLPRPLRLGTYLENVAGDAATAYYWDLCLLKPPVAAALLGDSKPWHDDAAALHERITAVYRACPSLDPVQRAEYADLKIYLANDVLAKVDRMSMAHSLEVRCPLLDRRLVELAFRIPQSLKRANRTGKHLLKRIAGVRLPQTVTGAPKRGFTAPVQRWIGDVYRHQFATEVLTARSACSSFVDPAVARRMFTDHVGGSRDHSSGLWALWIFERWLRKQRAPAFLGSPSTATETVGWNSGEPATCQPAR